MTWKYTNGEFDDLGVRGRIMGVLNVTLDSFFDGGKFPTVEKAVAHALAMAEEGAEIIDIGGESTRPGAEPVGAEEEMRRVLPVIEALAPELKALAGKRRCVISIDTSKAAVARAAVERGAAIINDVTGVCGPHSDPEMAAVARETDAGIVIMHMQGTPRTMQAHPHYENVAREVADFFRQSFTCAVTSGIHPMNIAFDPGIGFGKTAAHNLALLKSIESLRVEGRPLVVGASRKSFIGRIIGSESAEDRFWPTVAITSLAREHGAEIVRVHDVRANVEAMRMTEAIIGSHNEAGREA